MVLNTLELRDFRCYKAAAFNFCAENNIIHGENGAGKTSLLEAVYYMSSARSFRRAPDIELIKRGKDAAHITARYERNGVAGELKAIISRKKKRELYYGGAPLPSPRRLLGILPCVLFSPEDLSLIYGGPGERRRYLDIMLSQTEPGYVAALSKYNKLTAEKTAALKRAAVRPEYISVLPEYNAQLAEYGSVVSSHRLRAAERLAPLLKSQYAFMCGGPEPDVRFHTHAAERDRAMRLMDEKRGAEIARGQCLVGCHKDDMEISVGKAPLRDFGSRGQCRAAAIAMKMAQRDIFREEMGAEPLLLLDDAHAELDKARREKLFAKIEGCQLIITTCEPDSLRYISGNTILLGKEE
ncbi:MAG: DNA replication/repair protein RecF [Oscillospiraceae bacterium]|jgi:DNA replication and repair protein RecF|nr:DNA replication/repair protein RecF [Oscillospiraceae bacterium]